MKIKRNRVVLERGEQRFGNFVVKDSGNAIEVTDINLTCKHIVSVGTARGVQLREMLSVAWKKKNARKFIEAYCTVIFQTLTCVVDYELLSALLKDGQDCIGRHKDIYGIKDEVDKADDDAVLREEVELAETIEAVRKEEGL